MSFSVTDAAADAGSEPALVIDGEAISARKRSVEAKLREGGISVVEDIVLRGDAAR